MANVERSIGPARASRQPEQQRPVSHLGAMVRLSAGIAFLGAMVAATSQVANSEGGTTIPEAARRQRNGEPFPDPYRQVRQTKWDPKRGLEHLGGTDFDTRSEETVSDPQANTPSRF